MYFFSTVFHLEQPLDIFSFCDFESLFCLCSSVTGRHSSKNSLRGMGPTIWLAASKLISTNLVARIRWVDVNTGSNAVFLLLEEDSPASGGGGMTEPDEGSRPEIEDIADDR